MTAQEPLSSSLLQTLQQRGFIHQATDLTELDAKAATSTLVAYIGFDATAPSLHVGSLLQIMLLRHIQHHGHKPIVLVGGGTTRVGDPTGKDRSRQLLGDDTITANTLGIRGVLERFLTFGDGPTDAVMVDNADWLLKLNYIDFLRDYGRHFSVNRMLTFDSVRQRLEREQPLSFLEFNYMIMQSYDFVELYRRYGCTLQMGGSDQWGNIVSGVELARRVCGEQFYGLTSPLLTTAEGTKMGKTSQGAIWLSADLLSPYEFWQFWRNVHDQDTERFLKLFTTLDLGDIHTMIHAPDAHINHAKVCLADAVTKLVHGDAVLPTIHQTVASLFQNSGDSDLSALPTLTVSFASQPSISLLHLLQQAGLCESSSEGRRCIRSQSVKINGGIVTDELRQISPTDFPESLVLRLSVGKKKHVAVKITSS